MQRAPHAHHLDSVFGYRYFIIYIRTDDVVDKDIVEDVKTRFDTINYELECFSTGRPLSKRKNKKAI